jgi:hypothetical protein
LLRLIELRLQKGHTAPDSISQTAAGTGVG